MASGMTPDDARSESRAALWRRAAHARTARDDRSLARRTASDAPNGGARSRRIFAMRCAGCDSNRDSPLAVILTLGLGIGANATMFGIVDRLLFRPPAYLIAPDRAARIYLSRSFRGKENAQSYIGYRRYLDLREHTTSFDAMTPFYVNNLAVGTGDATREMRVGVGRRRSLEDVRREAGHRALLHGGGRRPAESARPSPSFICVSGKRSSAAGATRSARPSTSAREVHGHRRRAGGIQRIRDRPRWSRSFRSAPTRCRGTTAVGEDPWYCDVQHDLVRGVRAAQARRDVGRQRRRSHQRVRAELSEAAREASEDALRIARRASRTRSPARCSRDRGPNEGSDAKVATWLIGVARDRAAHRLRERRQPAARARAPAPARDRGSHRARRQPGTPAHAAPHREPAARAARRRRRIAIAQWGGGVMRSAAARSDATWPLTLRRPATARVRRRARARRRLADGTRAGAAGGARRRRGGAQGRRARRHGASLATAQSGCSSARRRCRSCCSSAPGLFVRSLVERRRTCGWATTPTACCGSTRRCAA